MIDLEHELRRRADAARASVASALDIERDLAATLERAQSVGAVQSVVRHQRRPSMTAMAVAAALLVAVTIGAALVLRDDTPRHHLTVTPPPATDIDVPPPASSVVPESTMASPTSAVSTSTLPPTVATSGSEPSTVETNSAATTGCFAGVPYAEAARMFVSAMLAAREAGSLEAVSGCLSEVPAAFTGTPPACWTGCDGAPRIFAADSLITGEALYPAGDTVVSAFLPVTYQTASGYLDVSETWQMTPTDDGYVISNYALQEPPDTREQALATITQYLTAVSAQDWLTAATLLNGGAREPEERDDLRRLHPDDYSVDGIAAALAQWCHDGCDSLLPATGDLDFDGSFGLRRGPERLTVDWYEGYLSIVGLPFRTTAPNASTTSSSG